MIKIARAGKVIGEYNRGDVPALVQSKTVLTTDDYWTSGMAAWAKVSSLLSEIEASAPPPPRAQPPILSSVRTARKRYPSSPNPALVAEGLS